MLRQIRYFQTVVRLGSFSKAAEECYISQSAISQQVRALEQELGVTLLRRENRRVSLTDAGKHFYEKSLLLTADLDKLRKETVRIARGSEFMLRIGFLRGYGGSEFQRAVADFALKYPDIPLDARAGNHEELYDRLRGEQVDLVLSDQRRAFSDAYVNLPLAAVPCHIEVAARNPLAAGESVDVSALRGTPCILVASASQRETEQAHYRTIFGIEGEFLFADSLEEARMMAVCARGCLPVEGGEPPAAYGQSLVSLPLTRNGNPVAHDYCAFWKADNSGYYIETFAESLRAAFQPAS